MPHATQPVVWGPGANPTARRLAAVPAPGLAAATAGVDPVLSPLVGPATADGDEGRGVRMETG